MNSFLFLNIIQITFKVHFFQNFRFYCTWRGSPPFGRRHVDITWPVVSCNGLLYARI